MLLLAKARSSRLIHDDVAVSSAPLPACVQFIDRVEKRNRNPIGEWPCLPGGRKVIAVAQELLCVRQHEIEKQDGGLRVRCAPGDADAFKARDDGLKAETIDRRPFLFYLLHPISSIAHRH